MTKSNLSNSQPTVIAFHIGGWQWVIIYSHNDFTSLKVKGLFQ